MDYDLLVIGRPSCDVIFTGLAAWPESGRESFAGSVTVSAGGAFNAAAAASRLGLSAGFVGIVGTDMWSDLILEHFAAEGVSTQLLKVVDRPLPAVSVALNANGDRGFITHEAEAERADGELLEHVATVLAQAPPAHVHVHLVSGLAEIARSARKQGMSISVDAWGWEQWLCSSAVRELVPLGDVLLTNEPEAQLLTDKEDTLEALQSLSQRAPYVVVKRGPGGAIAARCGDIFEVCTEPVPVVDATGAGDCFNAGFLFGWLRGLAPEVCLSLGNICGGRSVQVVGGYHGCPNAEELRTLAEARGLEVSLSTP